MDRYTQTSGVLLKVPNGELIRFEDMKFAKIFEQIEFDLEQEIYIKTDEQQSLGLITGIVLDTQGVLYKVARDDSVSTHYGFELTTEKSIL